MFDLHLQRQAFVALWCYNEAIPKWVVLFSLVSIKAVFELIRSFEMWNLHYVFYCTVTRYMSNVTPLNLLSSVGHIRNGVTLSCVLVVLFQAVGINWERSFRASFRTAPVLILFKRMDRVFFKTPSLVFLRINTLQKFWNNMKVSKQ